MDTAKSTSEFVIAKVKAGSNLGQPGASGGDQQLFLDLVTLIKSQNGVLRQAWALEIENPELFVWQVKWETYEQTLRWVSSPTHNTLVASASEVFDFAAQPPIILYSQWSGDAATSVNAPVTELSFFSLPLNSTDKHKQEIIKEIEKLDRTAVNAGKATAVVTGRTIQTTKGVKQAEEYVSSQFGWKSVEASQKWRQSPEYASGSAAVVAGFAKHALDLTPASFSGVSVHTGLFHVNFTTSS